MAAPISSSSFPLLTGSLVALVTPMKDGQIQWQDLANLIDWHINSGTAGIVIAGTTGECATFSIDEQADLFNKAVELVAGRVPLIAGTGSNATSESVELTQAAWSAGADATLSVAPYYNKPSQEGLYQHFLAQADAVNIPQILYNVPGRTSCDLNHETVLRLAQHHNIIGLKDATGDLVRAQHSVADLPKDFLLYSGDDMSSLGYMRLGGHGCISVTANVKPAEMARMSKAVLDGQWAQALELDKALRFWHKNLFIESSPAPAKYALWKLGKITTADLRLPLVSLSDPCARIIDQGLS